MSEAHRSDDGHAHDPALDADRVAKIEQLLLVGLDHYFAAQYEQAINVWTRALFLDRSHARARAYIERARSAVAEGQRQSEELLRTGVDAFDRGEGDEARRLLKAAIDGGAPSEEALAVLDRLDRLELNPASPVVPRSPRQSPASRVGSSARRARSAAGALAVAGLVVAIVALGGYAIVSSQPAGRFAWRSWVTLQPAPSLNGAAPVVREQSLALPRRGEISLARARSLASAGHLSDALAALDLVRPTDPQRAEADRLRADIQRQLLALERSLPAPAPIPAERDRPDRRNP